jgi:hypothetical protein
MRAHLRSAQLQLISFWFTPPPELCHLSAVTIRTLGLLTMFTSMERVFCVAGCLCAHSQLVMKQ